MAAENLRIQDEKIKLWLASKKNKSKVMREAIAEKYQRELQEKYEKQIPKITVSDVP